MKGPAAQAAGAGFSDVTPEDWFAPYVDVCVEEGLMKGVGDGLFAPNAPLGLDQMLVLTARLYQLLAFLVRTAQGGRGGGREAPDCALLAAEYIVNHYETPITVEGLAAYASVSHSSLYRRFMKRFQMSPKRFLLEYRIERACALLASTGHSIQEISNSVGFEDPFYFSRAFKEVKGVSPRQYANQKRAE